MYFKSYRAMIGGPMVNYREDARQWFTVGVAWMGDSTTNCQGSNKPNIYARVSHYVDWIYNRTTTTRTEDPNIFSCKYLTDYCSSCF